MQPSPRRAFVLGTGPSLFAEPLLAHLADEVTFALGWPLLPFAPSFYCDSDYDTLDSSDEWLDSISYTGPRHTVEIEVRRAQREGWTVHPLGVNRHVWAPDVNILDGPFPSRMVSGAIFAVLLAARAGHRNIYLLGCDGHGFSAQHEGGLPKTENWVSGFHRAAAACHEKLAARGVRLVDLSTNGTLPLPRMRLADVL